MGEARRKSQNGLLPRSKKGGNYELAKSSRIVEWFPVTKKQRDDFISLSIKGGWIGIGLLVVLWLIVRFIGPALGWWIPADVR